MMPEPMTAIVSMGTADSLGKRPVYFPVTSAIPAGLTVLEEAVGPAGWRARLRVEASGPAFEGHFEGDPILPGIAHLVVVRHALRALRGEGAAVRELSAVRFRRLVRPGAVLEMTVGSPDALGACRFEVHAGHAVVASGRVRCRLG
jgi:3-hydroxymyristoyl/3-hydroxydecanoyl-(acyl carrier protein) dehydratase